MIEENVEVQPKGAVWVHVPKGRALPVQPISGGYIMLPNGDRAAIKLAIVNLAGAGSTEIVPAIADKRIMVVGLVLTAGAAGVATVTLKSATTAISPLLSLPTNGPLVLPLNPAGYARPPEVNEALNGVVTGAAVGCIAHYIEVPVDVDWPGVTL